MIYLEKNNLKELISDGFHLVDFYAEWCGPCKMLGSVLEDIKDVSIIKVDIDKFPKITEDFRVMSVPTMVFIKNGEEVFRTIGFSSEENVLENINNYLK